MVIFIGSKRERFSSSCFQVTATPYQLKYRIVYPYEKDERSDEQKQVDEIKYLVNNVVTHKSVYQKYHTDDGCEIPIHYLWDRMKSSLTDERALT